MSSDESAAAQAGVSAGAGAPVAPVANEGTITAAWAHRAGPHAYAALDLGTNNCRLLIARPAREGFRILDAFSRIVRLGEGLGASGRLSEAAIVRTLAALAICRDKIAARDVSRARLIATEACRAAHNGEEFLQRVRESIGIELEIIDRGTEAHLAAAGCAVLADPQARAILLFDIGGGSTEIVWLTGAEHAAAGGGIEGRVKAWTSLPFGVVSLSERFGGRDVDAALFEAMVGHVETALQPFVERLENEARCERFHLLGTSGTVTTLAGVHLGLRRYDRRRVDGIWMSEDELFDAMDNLCAMSFEERANHGCIGHERADLVLAGCAIFEGIRRCFPSPRVRIADRGLREGILMQMMMADNVWRQAGPMPAPQNGCQP